MQQEPPAQAPFTLSCSVVLVEVTMCHQLIHRVVLKAAQPYSSVFGHSKTLFFVTKALHVSLKGKGKITRMYFAFAVGAGKCWTLAM